MVSLALHIALPSANNLKSTKASHGVEPRSVLCGQLGFIVLVKNKKFDLMLLYLQATVFFTGRITSIDMWYSLYDGHIMIPAV